MKERTVKVNCSFCGKEIECPENMKNSEKHACFDCFQKISRNPRKRKKIGKVHVAIPKDRVSEMFNFTS